MSTFVVEIFSRAGKLTLTDTAAGKSYPVVCSLTERQQAILLAGGLLNYTKEHAL